jgi:hypothetical protein
MRTPLTTMPIHAQCSFPVRIGPGGDHTALHQIAVEAISAPAAAQPGETVILAQAAQGCPPVAHMAIPTTREAAGGAEAGRRL